MSDLLEVLDDRERKIIFQRFGLDGGKPKTLEEVGKKFWVTRERIRQLQNVALAKLRRALSKKKRLRTWGKPNNSVTSRKLSHLLLRGFSVRIDGPLRASRPRSVASARLAADSP